MVLIDGAKHGFLGPLLDGHEIGVAKGAASDVRYWKDAAGAKHAIDLVPYVQEGKLTVVTATAAEISAVLSQGVNVGLGAGEIEALALVLARGHRFCSAEGAVVKAMKALGHMDWRVPLEELLRGLGCHGVGARG